MPAAALLYRFVPALDALRSYTPRHLRVDVLAGLTVAAVAVPQAMAYAMVAGLPPEYGLYTAIVMTTVGALLDSSKQLINGPTNAISIAVLSAIAGIEGQDAKIHAAILLALLVGSVQLGITFLRLGDLTRYISHSVIVGFTAGAGTLLVIDQLKNLLGKSAVGDVHDHFLVRFWRTMVEGGPVHGPTLAVGLASIAAVLLLRWFKARIGWTLLPEFLIVVVGAAAATWAFGLDAMGVKVVGTIPAALPRPELPHLDMALVEELMPSAFAIGTLGLLEALAMAKAIAARTGQRLDLNQQCLSEGLANFTGAFFQCIPGSGSLTRSAINQQAGAMTQWSGVVSAVAVAGTMLLFAPYARFIPKACLAGLLIVSAARMVDWKMFFFSMRATRFDAIIVSATAISAFAISVEFCVIIGIVLSFLLAVPRVGQTLLSEFVITGTGAVHERLAEDVVCERILIFGIEGELFFGAAGSLEHHLDTIEGRVGPNTEVIVLRLKRARNPDAVGLHLFEEFLRRMEARRVHVICAGVRPVLHEAFKQAHLHIPEDRLFLEQPVRQTSTVLAMRAAYARISSPCPHCPRRDAPQENRELYYVW